MITKGLLLREIFGDVNLSCKTKFKYENNVISNEYVDTCYIKFISNAFSVKVFKVFSPLQISFSINDTFNEMRIISYYDHL